MAYGLSDPEDVKWFERIVEDYVQRVMQKKKYPDTLSRKGGMGNGETEQFYVFVQAGILFPDNPHAKQWLDRGVDWTRQVIDGYWPEGSGIECPRYHAWTQFMLCRYLPAIYRNTGINLFTRPGMKRGMEWWLRFISPPVLPGKNPYTEPAWGDTGYGTDFSMFPVVANYLRDADPDYSRRLMGRRRRTGKPLTAGWDLPLVLPQIIDLSLPGDPATPSAPVTSTYSPYYGHATMRSESGDANELYLTLKCGAVPNGHCNADQGSIELFAFGHPMVLDAEAGVYGPPIVWNRSTLAHNTVMFNCRNSDALADGKFQAFGAAAVADYATVAWMWPQTTARHIVMVKPDYVVIWDQAPPAGNVAEWLLHVPAKNIEWQPHKVVAHTYYDGLDMDIHFLLPAANLPAPTIPIESLTGKWMTRSCMASQAAPPAGPAPYTLQGEGAQGPWQQGGKSEPASIWGPPYTKFFSVRAPEANGAFLTVLHPRKLGATAELKPELVGSSSSEVSLRIKCGGRLDTITINNQGATITKGGQPTVRFARTFPQSGIAGPARFILSQDNATETLTRSLTTDGAVEVCIGTLVLGVDNAIPATAPVIVRPSGTLDLGGHSTTIEKLVMDCGAIVGAGMLSCDSIDWYGGTISPETRIACRGKFRKFAGGLTRLPANISCAGGLCIEGRTGK